jgi:O-Antigen ligase
MSPRAKALIAGIVATSVALTALADGGYSTEARAVIAMLTWTAVLSGLLYGLFPRSRPPDAALAVGLLLAALAALTLGSSAWASDDGAVVQQFLKVGAYLGLFALVVFASREGQLRPWITGLAVGITAVAAIALVSRLIPALPGGDEEIIRQLPAAHGRLSYPIGYWNGLSALLATGLLLLGWFGAFARTRGGRSLATGTIPLLGLALYLTSSRGGLLALIGGAAVLLLLGPRRPALGLTAVVAGLGTTVAILIARGEPAVLDPTGGGVSTSGGLVVLGATLVCMALTGLARGTLDYLPPPRLRIPRPRAAAVAGAAVALIALIAVNPVQRFDDFKKPPTAASQNKFIVAHLTSGSSNGRWQFWGEAVDAFESEPLHGLGAGGYAAYWSQHAPIDLTVTRAHSLYLEQLADLGLLGLLLVLGPLAIGALRGVLDRRTFAQPNAIGALVAVMTTGGLSAAIDWTWDLPAVFAPVVISLGLLCGPAPALAAGRALGGRRPVPSRRLGRGWAIGAAVIGTVILLAAADSFLADRSLERSRSAVSDHNLQGAADDARAAIALEPWASEPRLQLALIQESAADYSAADDTIKEAIERAPDDWHLWLVRARIATLHSSLTEANQAFARARELNPRAPVFTDLTGPLGG